MAMTLVAPLALMGCDTVKGVSDGIFGGPGTNGTAQGTTPVVGAAAPADAADTAPQAEVPVALPVSGSASLGTTVASLGDPASPGLWMETPLTRREQTGEVRYQGSTVTLTLRPTGGEPGSGSRLSLLAMQALGAPLTELIEVSVTGAR
ncbi:hypothetical protein ATO3_04650 [Marinibacterium profundimaris]|uniref:D-galactarate dehydratase n=2 Tax=Marinibacterium profundimaris TaxID=1679460 RepID=A0A225NSV4_9RHOB|nr:hypothetical protein ATO3_04650 [Marinibacterium profundimaris]